MKKTVIFDFPDGFHFPVSYRNGEKIEEIPCEGCPFDFGDHCFLTKENPSEHPKCPFYGGAETVNFDGN